MQDLTCLLAVNLKAFVVVMSVVSVLVLAFAIFFIWWVDKRRGTMKELWKAIGYGFCHVFDGIRDLFTIKKEVKTVYSDKSLNYSGTEFLPIPTKAPTNQYTYEFVGWDKNGVDGNGNTVVSAIFLQKVTKCYINVYNDDKETLIGTYEVEYGSGINLDSVIPSKPDTKEFSYEFMGWDKETNAFYKNENIYAMFNAVPKKYTYTFYEDDGVTIVNQGKAIYGTPISAPVAPKKEPDANGIYEFAGWRNFEEGLLLTKDRMFVATYRYVPMGANGDIRIVKMNNDEVKVELQSDETELKPNDEEILNFDTPKINIKPEHEEFETEKQSTGIIQKRKGLVIEMNNVEKFKKINSGEKNINNDNDVHQKIQLMTVKRPANVEANDDGNVIKLKPKAEKKIDDEMFDNIMINRVKINKKDDI